MDASSQWFLLAKDADNDVSAHKVVKLLFDNLVVDEIRPANT